MALATTAGNISAAPALVSGPRIGRKGRHRVAPLPTDVVFDTPRFTVALLAVTAQELALVKVAGGPRYRPVEVMARKPRSEVAFVDPHGAWKHGSMIALTIVFRDGQGWQLEAQPYRWRGRNRVVRLLTADLQPVA